MPLSITVPRTWATAGLALLIGISAFVFRFSTFELTNDDYLHLVSAQLVLLGEVPVRDFLDPGEFLLYMTSAGAQYLFGQTMLSEIALNVTGLAVAYMFCVALGIRLTGSRIGTVVVIALALLLFPRLYAYPKLLVYASTLWCLARYADAPSSGRLTVVALAVSVAFLFRHDHGVYVGLASLLMLLLVHVHEGWRALARQWGTLGLLVLLALSPFFVFLHRAGGIEPYFRNGLETARGEYNRTSGNAPRFVWALALPHVRVGWASDVDVVARTALERQYHLRDGELRGDGEWDYGLADASPTNLGALVTDPRVRSTGGFDTDDFSFASPLEDPNVLAWFYYLTFAAAPLALLILGYDVWRRPHRVLLPPERLLVTTAGLAIVMNGYLMRSAAESAVGDVSAVTALVCTWLLVRGMRVRPLTWASVLGAITTVVVVAVSAFLLSRSTGAFRAQQLLTRIDRAGLLETIEDRANTARRLTAPFDRPVTRYVFECTAPTDRLLITFYAPDLQYGSGRGYAAGRSYFVGSFGPSAETLAFSLEKLQRERVPVVLINENYGPDFATPFPAFAQYLDQQYKLAGQVPGDDGIQVLVDSRLQPTGSYLNTDLPCFR